MDTIEVPVLKYKFHFRKLTWRDEFTIRYPAKVMRERYFLANALADVSGLPIKTVEEGLRVLSKLPTPILSRVYIIYKGNLDPPRSFVTAGLYRAPEPQKFQARIEEDDSKRDKLAEAAQEEMNRKFSRKELDQASQVDQQIVKASKMRGAVRVDASHAD